MRALRHRDFLILWIGALFSFTGSWIQNIAQQVLVFDLTRDEAKLGLVAFCASAPVAVLGPVAGVLADRFDKRFVLVAAQTTLGLGALTLALLTQFNVVEYWHILTVATIIGVTGSVEMPTRQSVVGRAVPPEDLPSAVPLQAMTFNLARIVGPAVGSIILVSAGVTACYFTNAVSYLGLIIAVMLVRANLKPSPGVSEPIRDLLIEGLRFTFSDIRLRTLFVMESVMSAFGLAYLALMAALVQETLGLDKKSIGFAMSLIGIGAILGLLFIARQSAGLNRGRTIRVSMTVFGLALLMIGIFPTANVAFPLFGVLGMCAIMQFNTTNTVFQLIAPERLRGRVIAMHIWALSGIGPFGTLFFGWLASKTSIPVVLIVGGLGVLFGAAWGWSQRQAFVELP